MMNLLLLLLVLLPLSEAFELVVGLPLRNTDELEKKFWLISDPQSAEYLQHQSLPELADLVGASQKDVSLVSQWLLNIGATGVRVSNLRDTVTASFPVATTSTNTSQWTMKGLPHQATHPLPFDFVLRRDPLPKTTNASIRKKGPGRTLVGYSIGDQKKAYGIPVDLTATNPAGLQMVWGPGTFGYDPADLERFRDEQCPLLNLEKVKFDTANHGTDGGDNFEEGTLDSQMIASFGLNVSTLISNTNSSRSTEEGKGFGQALLDFVTELASRKTLPQVLSISLGSLGAYSCDLLCSEAVKRGHSMKECTDYLQQQRQVCMYISQQQVARIHTGFQLLGNRGVSVFGSSGDGGSHFSFQEFQGGAIADTLNEISCAFQIPVFPTESPYVISVGGTQWQFPDSAAPGSAPQAWTRSGGGLSWQFPAPPHQSSVVQAYLKSTKGLPPSSSYNSTGRAYPDISAVAVEGTSQSSPTVAGIFSLLMDQRLNKGLKPLGFLAPRLWQVMQNNPGEAFQDIASGNTKTSCDNGFPGVKGWDAVTGWGRPKWAGIVKHFATDN